MKRKLKPGYYVAEAPASTNPLEDSRYVCFRWTKDDQAVVDKVRRRIKPLENGIRWLTVRTGPGPNAQFFDALPEWIYRLTGVRDLLDSGHPVEINREDGERLLTSEGDGVTRVDCVHLTINNPELYVGAYGKHSGTHWETRDLT